MIKDELKNTNKSLWEILREHNLTLKESLQETGGHTFNPTSPCNESQKSIDDNGGLNYIRIKISEKYSLDKIAKELGITKYAVMKYIQNHNLSYTELQRQSHFKCDKGEEIEYLRNLKKKYDDIEVVAEKCNYPTKTLRHFLCLKGYRWNDL